MHVRTTLKPGQKGTLQLTREYGDRLICVRYHYDPVKRMRYKTVELIVDERPWQPPEPGPYDHVLVRISCRETQLQTALRERGARWDRSEKAWRTLWTVVQELGLERRVIYVE